MQTYLFYSVFLFLWFVETRGIEFTTCDIQQQLEVTNSFEYPCEPRPKMVDLKPRIANLSDVIDIVPDVVMVARCGGNCEQKQHKCIPAKRKMKPVQVIFIMTGMVNSINDHLCGSIEVEEHELCDCGCHIKPDDCYRNSKGTKNPFKRFDREHCQCRCRNRKDELKCIKEGREWDDANCRCVCQSSKWHECSSGYVYDHELECRCIPVNLTASVGLIAALLVLLACALVMAIGFYTMYRSKTGIFKHLREKRLSYDCRKFSLHPSADDPIPQETDSTTKAARSATKP